MMVPFNADLFRILAEPSVPVAPAFAFRSAA